MKKIMIPAVALGLMATSFGAADARHPQPAHLIRDGQGGWTVGMHYADTPRTGWYVTARAGLNLLNWTNSYNSDFGNIPSNSYSFETLFGGSITAGRRFGYHWRGELELGTTGNFKDAGYGVEFNMQTHYLMVNAVYDFLPHGFYLGAGLGIAVPMMTLDFDGTWTAIGGSRRTTNISPMGALMAGFAVPVGRNFALDVRYRLAGWWGGDITRRFDNTGIGASEYFLTVDTGFVMENSISVGLRYEF